MTVASGVATLAGQVNHSFTNNSRYVVMSHPRWGRILGVVTARRVEAGQEITCNYGYSMDSEAVPDWFRAAWAAHTAQDRRTKGS